MAPRRPTSTGIKRIESEEARQVCFSKRRKGLFKKLNELSIMCGSKVAAVVFSPGGKAFSFGHPSVDSVLNRFCTSNSSEAAVDGGDSDGEGDRSLALEELNREDRELCAQLAAIKARNEAVDEYFAKARADGCQVAAWLDMVTDVSQMSDEDLAAFQAALAKVGADVAARCNQVLQEALLFGRPMQGGGGGGGEFELGGTSASGGTEMAQQQQVMMLDMPPPPPPTGFAAGTEMMQQQMMLEMPPPPPRTGFAARTEMVQQQMMMLKMPPPPPPTGFAGTEMMQQQQMMMAMPPPTGLDGTEMVQQQMMLEMPPPPPRTGFAAGMEMVQQQMMMQEMPLTGFAAGTEMMQQQQIMMAMPPPPMGFAGMETVQQQQMRMAMPPLPKLAAAMGTLHQGFGHDFPQ